MKFSVTYTGLSTFKGSAQAMFGWQVMLNGEQFEYRTGLAHCVPAKPGAKRPEGTGPTKVQVDGDDVWPTVPKQDDVLYCLFSDARAADDSFQDFCDNCGYSTDSMTAMDTYRACMESARKLRKALGSKYHVEMARIDALEL